MKPLDRLLTVLDKNHRFLLFLMIGLELVGGIVYSIYLGSELPYYDEREYFTLAKNLADNGSFSYDGETPSAFRPPGYPLFLALFIFVGGGVVVCRIVNFVALAGCIYLTNAILQKQFSNRAGLLGAALILGYPVLSYTAGTLYPQTIGSFLLVSIFYLLFNRDENSLRPYVLIGICFGILLLLIPSFSFVLLTVFLWVFYYRSTVRFKAAAAVAVTPAIMMGLWSLRCYVIFHAFVFGSANSGLMLLLGNSENTTPNSGPNADISRYSDAAPPGEIGRDAFFKAKAVEYIKNNQGRVAELYVLKVLNYFNYRNDLATKSEMSTTRDLVMLATYGPLLLLFLIRLLYWRRHPFSRFEILVVFVYLSNAFFAAIFFPRVRYRLPFDFLMIWIVAGFIDTWIRSRRQTQANLPPTTPVA